MNGGVKLNEFVKKVVLKPTVDEAALDNAKKAFEQIEDKTKKISKAGGAFFSWTTTGGESSLAKGLDRFTGNFAKTLTGFSEGFGSGLLSVGETLISSFAKKFGEALDELDAMLDYQYLTDEGVRTQAFTYGLDPSQNYGLSKALDFMGFSSVEDLAWADNTQRQKFYEVFTKYTEKYNSLHDSGFFEKMQEYNWEMQDLQEEIKYEVMDWIVNNKGLIVGFMNGSIAFFKSMLNIVSSIGNWLGISSVKYVSGANADSIVSNYMNSGNKNTNVTYNNNFNGIGSNVVGDIETALGLQQEQLVRSLGG